MKTKETTVVNLKRFPEDLHRQAKSKAALEGISLQEFIIRAVTEYLKKQK
jgi:predicted HicB family RNase H-like nuclease